MCAVSSIGKHEEKKDEHGIVSRTFTRKYTWVDPLEVHRLWSGVSYLCLWSINHWFNVPHNDLIIMASINHTVTPWCQLINWSYLISKMLKAKAPTVQWYILEWQTLIWLAFPTQTGWWCISYNIIVTSHQQSLSTITSELHLQQNLKKHIQNSLHIPNGWLVKLASCLLLPYTSLSLACVTILCRPIGGLIVSSSTL